MMGRYTSIGIRKRAVPIIFGGEQLNAWPTKSISSFVTVNFAIPK